MQSASVILLLALVASVSCYRCTSTGNVNVTANGKQPINGQFPHHALLESDFAEGKRYCSGAMVSRQFVLTVAQCVQGATTVKVTLGANCLLEGGDNKYRYTFTALEYFVKEGFSDETFENDVAMVQFTDEEVRLPPWVAPVALPAVDEQHVSEEVFTSGYGLLSFSAESAADSLQFLKLTVLDYEQCQDEFQFVTPESGQFCAQREDAQPNCVSDVGSPLVVKRKGYMKYTLLGLTSFGQKFACSFGNPGALQEVRAHVEWVQSFLEDGEEVSTTPATTDAGPEEDY
ncbi:brachyurin-like [Wyeomyia smithii]|uniref:brachyurin-like n=1 Tax=Wyeomyia smithii TaxID=174621 RepID=UPI002467D1E6|nr:brachyurin-like [Wyeomyia smithii]